MKLIQDWKQREAERKAKRLLQLELNQAHKLVGNVEYRVSPATGKKRPIKPKVRRND